MRTLVTGAAGFIGSTLVDRLLVEGHHVIGVDNLCAGSPATNLCSAHRHKGPGLFTFVAVDVRHAELAEVVVRFKPDVIFHLAAQTDVRRSVADPQHDARNNVLGTINLLEASRRAGVRRIVYAASGGSRYGAPATLPVTEEAAVDPLSPHAVSSVANELYLRAYAAMYGLAPICLALSNVYGPRQYPHARAGVVTLFASALICGRPTTIYGDGSSTRDYVYVDDVVTAFLCAADAPAATVGTFNIGTGVQTTVAELHEMIAGEVGAAGTPDYLEARTGEVHASALDPTLAARVLGWKPDTDLTDGIKRTVDWLRIVLDPRPAAVAGA
ncbi:NAD-dependent epimerase/dehydratase family protein [Mycobacterium parmense]|uniref:Putative UDP-glucose 4-epimerase GalE1 n=1 Tax=Mycobacterium parmense TaxID=185642 RepID=A0A7I7Z1V6_9MYCO|nr:NAD-dependent epimerase/dehydratase family protein [Mycobacterium parmense]MCV7352108.1 GDP-mannose 4,6-dehydratase [Mycobacterium parmense]ORW56105.1 UDP-glucose 4-epimerase [Mycobacterium parmense]BBZ48175.1 putative UDP-glucose 4-epimerase GalE1 [Mycobacterium parmense]